jgi:hypothetical protein
MSLFGAHGRPGELLQLHHPAVQLRGLGTRPATTSDDLRRPATTRRDDGAAAPHGAKATDLGAQRRSTKRRAPTWKNGLENGFRHDLTNSVEICGNHLLR